MIRYLLLTLFVPFHVLAQAPLLSSEQLQQAAELRDQALESDLAWSLLESLTTEVGPRMAGSPGDARAVAWGQATMKAHGFDRVWIEPFEFPRWVRGAESGAVVSPHAQALHLTALGGSVGTPEGGLQAPIVVFDDLEALQNAEDGSLTGRIAFISNRMARQRDGSGYGPAVAARRDGASVAASKGALAVLIRSIGTDDNRTPHTGTMRYAEDKPKIPAAALSNPDADQLVRLSKLGEPVVVRIELGAHIDGVATSHNVIGEMTGRSRPEERVVIGCHLDSWDLGTGAIDDGAGCALTLAAAVLAAELRPARTVRVVLWGNEEQGLIGARAYGEAHKEALAQHLIGAESDFGAGRIYRFSSRVKPEALGVVDQISQVLAPLGIVRGDNNAFGGPDLIPMRQMGMAVATLHQDGTEYFDYHHTANDTLDKVDPEALRQNLAAWVTFTWLSAQAEGDFGFGLGLPADNP